MLSVRELLVVLSVTFVGCSGADFGGIPHENAASVLPATPVPGTSLPASGPVDASKNTFSDAASDVAEASMLGLDAVAETSDTGEESNIDATIDASTDAGNDTAEAADSITDSVIIDAGVDAFSCVPQVVYAGPTSDAGDGTGACPYPPAAYVYLVGSGCVSLTAGNYVPLNTASVQCTIDPSMNALQCPVTVMNSMGAPPLSWTVALNPVLAMLSVTAVNSQGPTCVWTEATQ